MSTSVIDCGQSRFCWGSSGSLDRYVMPGTACCRDPSTRRGTSAEQPPSDLVYQLRRLGTQLAFGSADSGMQNVPQRDGGSAHPNDLTEFGSLLPSYVAVLDARHPE